MRKKFWPEIVGMAALGVGLALTGALSMRQPKAADLNEFGSMSDISMNNNGGFAVEMNGEENSAVTLSDDKTVLEAEISSAAGDDYVPQTKPPEPGGYTLPESAQLENGSIGQLIIEKIDVSAPVYETDDEMEAMRKGVAHYKISSAWDGNVGLCAHNGTASYCWFRDLHKLEAGDEVVYKTALGSRIYRVSTVTEISETDWSMLGQTDDNRLTMTTCINGRPDRRLCVQAVEKEDDV